LLTVPSDLDQLTDDFPEDFFKMKVLPELLKSVEFGGGGPKAFGVVVKIAGKLSNEDFEAKVTPVVVRLFANPDRAIRVCLLDNLSHMIDRLPQKVVNDKIFPQMVCSWPVFLLWIAMTNSSPGHRFHGSCPRCARTDFKSSPRDREQAL
jgi:hypothetical protein